MKKEEALELLMLEEAAQKAEIDARANQIKAFLETNSGPLFELASQTETLFQTAHEVLEKEQQVQNADQKPASDTSGAAAAIKSFIFPVPTETAGEPLSEQWWRVYTRVVLLALAFTGLVLYFAPNMVRHASSTFAQEAPRTEPYQNPSEQPATIDSGSPFGEVGPPPVSGSKTAAHEFELEQIPRDDSSSQSTTARGQGPKSFLHALFSALEDGSPVQSMIKQPPNLAVARMLSKKHPFCPDLNSVSDDAFVVLSNSDSAAIVRVKEEYFTGLRETNDYYLVGDSSGWKLIDIRSSDGYVP